MTHWERLPAPVRGAQPPGSGGYGPSQVLWLGGALCREVGPFLFDEAFDDPDGTGRLIGGTMAHRHSDERRSVARTICQVCPLLDDCAEQAFTNAEKYGIWAGHSQIQRGRLAMKLTSIAECVVEVKKLLFAEGKSLNGVNMVEERKSRVTYARAQADVLRVQEAQMIEVARQRGTLRSSVRGAQKNLPVAQIAS